MSEDLAFRELGEALSQFDISSSPPPQQDPYDYYSDDSDSEWIESLEDMHNLPLDLLFEVSSILLCLRLIVDAG